MVAGPRQMCCFDTISDSSFSGGMCRLESGGGVSMNTGDVRDRNGSRVSLEPATEFLVLARLEAGGVSRVRTFTPDCDIDATAMPLVWLTDVKPDESVAWLASLVAAAPDTGDGHDRVGKTAMSAVALHNVPSADRALERFVAPARPEWLRGDTAFWLGSTRGEAGARLLARMIAQDPSDKVRDKVDLRPLGQQGAGGADHADRDGARRQEHQGPRSGAVLAGAEGRQGGDRRPSPARSTTIRTPR